MDVIEYLKTHPLVYYTKNKTVMSHALKRVGVSVFTDGRVYLWPYISGCKCRVGELRIVDHRLELSPKIHYTLSQQQRKIIESGRSVHYQTPGIRFVSFLVNLETQLEKLSELVEYHRNCLGFNL